MAPPNLVNFPKIREMTISKATFAPSTPCTIYFECLQSGPNDSTRVRPITGILRHARVKIFILVMGAFGPTFRIFEQFDREPRNQNCKIDMELQIKTLKMFMSNLRYLVSMTKEDVLNRFRTFRGVKLQPVWSYRY